MLPFFLFFQDTAAAEIYPLSLHDALPIFLARQAAVLSRILAGRDGDPIAFDRRHFLDDDGVRVRRHQDRKSTRLNSSHLVISYAVFCLKKKNHPSPQAPPNHPPPPDPPHP